MSEEGKKEEVEREKEKNDERSRCWLSGKRMEKTRGMWKRDGLKTKGSLEEAEEKQLVDL